jgi:hypothetical protein
MFYAHGCIGLQFHPLLNVRSRTKVVKGYTFLHLIHDAEVLEKAWIRGHGMKACQSQEGYGNEEGTKDHFFVCVFLYLLNFKNQRIGNKAAVLWCLSV